MTPLAQARARLAAIEAIDPHDTRLDLEDLHTLALSAALMAVTIAEIAEGVPVARERPAPRVPPVASPDRLT